MNLSDWDSRQQRVIGDLLEVCLVDHSTIQFIDQSGDPIPRHAAICRIPSVPELDFARHDFLAVFDTFLPVVEYSCLEKSVLDSPWPDIPKLLKEIFPLPKTMSQSVVGLPVIPKRKHLPQSSLIREDHEYAASKSFARSLLAALVQSKKIVVRGDFFFFDFGEPLHSRYSLHGANELLDRPHGFQHDDILGNEIMGFGLEPRPSRLHSFL